MTVTVIRTVSLSPEAVFVAKLSQKSQMVQALSAAHTVTAPGLLVQAYGCMPLAACQSMQLVVGAQHVGDRQFGVAVRAILETGVLIIRGFSRCQAQCGPDKCRQHCTMMAALPALICMKRC
jgi:hypothetical protein